MRSGTRDSVNGPGGTYIGGFIDDFEYTGAGDMDECNGMTVNDQYGYHVTDSYPWVLGCFFLAPRKHHFAKSRLLLICGAIAAMPQFLTSFMIEGN